MRLGLIYSLLSFSMAFLAAGAAAQESNKYSEYKDLPVGAVFFGAGYNLDVGLSVFGRLKHDQFLAPNQKIDIGFAISDVSQSYDLLLENEGVFGATPRLAFSVSHRTSDRQETLGIDTTVSELKPRLVFDGGASTTSVSAIVRRDEVSNTSVAPVLLQDEAGKRDVYGLGLEYQARRANAVYSVSSDFLTDGEDLSFAKAETSAHRAFNLNAPGLDVELRAAAGAIVVFGGQTTINDRFLPASGTLRGFEAAGFGPVDPSALNGAPVGATRYAVMSLDVRQKGIVAALPGLSFGAFMDVGSSWGLDEMGSGPRASIDDAAKLRGALGLTMSREFGPARLELVLAHPFRHEDADRLQQLQINFTSRF